MTWSAELRSHGEYGVEAQILRNGELSIGRRFPLKAHAVRWAEDERGHVGKVADGVHILRHTFCSHLAMRGAPARAIQELAGHQDLGTTQRHLHLSPAAIEGAIRLLDQGTNPDNF